MLSSNCANVLTPIIGELTSFLRSHAKATCEADLPISRAIAPSTSERILRLDSEIYCDAIRSTANGHCEGLDLRCDTYSKCLITMSIGPPTCSIAFDRRERQSCSFILRVSQTDNLRLVLGYSTSDTGELDCRSQPAIQ